MTMWTETELESVSRAEELRLSTQVEDGTLSPPTTMWVVRVGDDLFVRSAGGPKRRWYRHALSGGKGHIQAGIVDAEVTFATESEHEDEIDRAYHAKYDRYGQSIVGHVTGSNAQGVTIRLIKADSNEESHS